MGAAYGEGCKMRATSSGSEIKSSANMRGILAYIARKIYSCSIYTKTLRRPIRRPRQTKLATTIPDRGNPLGKSENVFILQITTLSIFS
jgi:hypothetical protein